MTDQKRVWSKFEFGNVMLEGSLGVFVADLLLVIFVTIFSNRFLTSNNFFAISRAFSLWIRGYINMSFTGLLPVFHLPSQIAL